MGYTHYAHQHRSFTVKEWSRICAEAKVIFFKATIDGIPLRDWDGEGKKPTISDERIAFNGRGDDGHETFSVTSEKEPCPEWKEQADYDREGAFNFCKTARKPYDPVVVSMMVMIKAVAPSAYDFDSDGGMEVFEDDCLYFRGLE